MAEINLTTGANPIEIQSLGGAIEINGLVADPPVTPVAGFTISDDTPDVNATVTFTDTSTNSPTSWSWAVSGGSYSFVGGTSSTSQNPQIQFSSSSTSYTITLTATNGAGSDNFADGVVTNAAGSAPVASFTISDTTPDELQVITLTDTSSNSPTSWSWTIGGGIENTHWEWVTGNASSQNPTLRFLAGTGTESFDINLEATNGFGSNNTAFSNNVTVNATSSHVWPAAHFEFDPFIYGDADEGGTTAPTLTYGTPTYNAGGWYEYDNSTNQNGVQKYQWNNGINDAVGSMEIWFYYETGADGAVLGFSRDNSSSYRGRLFINSSLFAFFLRTSSSAVQINLDWNYTFTTGWHHVVICKTADGGSSPSYNYKCYINGVDQGNRDVDNSTATTGLWLDDVDNLNPWNISVGGIVYSNRAYATNPWGGYIGRVAIYQNSLSSTEVSDNYTELTTR